MNFLHRFLAFARTAGPGSRLRFAPTPSGYLHIGNAVNFTLNWLVARTGDSKILLRIDDLDAERKRPEYVADIFERLRWLGLDWDEGPGLVQSEAMTSSHRLTTAIADFEQNWSQHRRLPLYFNVLEKLRDTGLLFACRKSRRDLEPFDGAYPPEFRDQNLHLDDPDVAWRIQTPPDFPMPDFVVRRRDALPAYQVASLVDDIHFGISHIIRGEDLEASTRAQRFLAECLGETTFLQIQFLHHPLITDERGEKLSKSMGATSLKAMQEGGAGVEPVFRWVGEMLGVTDATSASGLLERLKSKMRLPDK
ncbi:MAG TPA: glutamate--tRNA ligase family protein [Saprospiraceae bacterium]|nr:glutamate--tRNA ligase family protein [Saprospiraceae bacterium]